MAGGNIDEAVSRVTAPIQSGASGILLILLVTVGSGLIVSLILPNAPWALRGAIVLVCGGFAAIMVWRAKKRRASELALIREAQFEEFRQSQQAID
ncbi:MAG: hypothetical protein AB8B85_20940 [Paracoccaceae bacterium]